TLAFADIGHRFCVDQRALKRIGRADVWLGATRPYRHSQARAGDLRARTGHDLALFNETVDDLRTDKEDVKALAGIDPLLQPAGGVPDGDHFVAGRAFECWRKLSHC